MNWDRIQGNWMQVTGQAKDDAAMRVAQWQRKATDAWFSKK